MKIQVFAGLLASALFIASQTVLASSWDRCSGTIAETGANVRIQTNFGWPWKLEVTLSEAQTGSSRHFWADVKRSEDSYSREYVSDSGTASNKSVDLSIDLASCTNQVLFRACSGEAKIGDSTFAVTCGVDHVYTPAQGSPCIQGHPCH